MPEREAESIIEKYLTCWKHRPVLLLSEGAGEWKEYHYADNKCCRTAVAKRRKKRFIAEKEPWLDKVYKHDGTRLY